MTQPSKVQQQKTKPLNSSSMEKSSSQKLKAEDHEVAGKHKNSGQKDHKGAR